MGCPIRRSPDQRALASPRSLSQRATSFIASRRQGIHQMPFVHFTSITPPQPQDRHPTKSDDFVGTPPADRTAIRKTRPRPCNGSGTAYPCCRTCPHDASRYPKATIVIDGSMPAFTSSPFTMSSQRSRIPATAGIVRPSHHCPLRRPVAGGTGPPRSRETSWGVMVGPGRFERPTSPLSGVRSNQLSYGPGTPEIGDRGTSTGSARPSRWSIALRTEGICRRRPPTGALPCGS